MKHYIGTKIIEAEPAVRVDGKVQPVTWPIPIGAKVEDGYKVRYSDGYESWSPKAVFEEAYRPTEAMTFGLAIEAAKKGHKIARKGWNGKGMFLYYVPEGRYPARTDAAKSISADDGRVDYGAYIAMKTVQGKVVPWLASQTDILEDDWCIKED